MIKSCVAMVEKTHETYADAWERVNNEILDLIKKGQMSYQLLETAVWIEENKFPLFFYDARDKAIEMGLKVG